MRRRWLILILAVLPFGALAALGARFDVSAWLSDRLADVRAAVAPDPHASRPEFRSAERSGPEGASRAPRQSAGEPGGGVTATDQPSRVSALDPALTAPAALTRPATPPGPSIDIVRIDPSQGMTVVAGTGLPNSKVTIVADGEAIAVVTADANGEWVMITTHEFASADPTFTVEPGALPIPRRALAEARANEATPAGRGSGDGLLRPTAATETRRMIRELERLTDEAAADRSGANRAVANLGAAAERDAVSGARSTGRALSTANIGSVAADARPSALAVPVQFRYREADFTDEGRKAAALLLRYFTATGFRKVTLSGHADERGSDSSNMTLSKARLESLAAFLRDGGFEGELVLLPKGESEAYTGVDRTRYPIEELWQLDRRVEVVSVE